MNGGEYEWIYKAWFLSKGCYFSEIVTNEIRMVVESECFSGQKLLDFARRFELVTSRTWAEHFTTVQTSTVSSLSSLLLPQSKEDCHCLLYSVLLRTRWVVCYTDRFARWVYFAGKGWPLQNLDMHARTPAHAPCACLPDDSL